MIVPHSKWPKYIRNFTEVKAIHIHACPHKWPWDNGEFTHVAYNHDTKTFDGKICLRYKKYLYDKIVMYHEIAHLLCAPNKYHNDRWRQKMYDISNGLIDTSYVKKSRPCAKYRKRRMLD